MKKFVRFLKENGAFPKFFKELEKNNDEYSTFVLRYKKNQTNFFNNVVCDFWIDYGLHWSDTFNGHNYWSTLDNKWRTYCYELKRKNEI